jgi:putative MATE family efflux protein
MSPSKNPFLCRSIPIVFVKTAVPIIIVMLVNGMYNLVDAYFLGRYVGELALSAVTFVFPVQMLLIAFGALFASGMASILARNIGANNIVRASQLFINSQILVVLVFFSIALIYILMVDIIVDAVDGGFSELISMCKEYISVLIYFGPVLGVLALNIDALRSEGKLMFMSLMILLSAVLNILFDYIFIAKLGYGVVGAAYATVLAQLISLLFILVFRVKGKSILPFAFGKPNGLKGMFNDLKEIVPLGIPAGLGYAGVALIVGSVNYNVYLWSGEESEAIVAAHGIVARLMMFAILPLVGLKLAFSAIIGNNYGAGHRQRINETITLGLRVSAAYCIIVQLVFIVMGSNDVGSVFVNNENIVQHISRILVLVTAGFFIFGPLMLISAYFQAIGHAKNAILLGISRNYIFMLPLVFLLPYFQGETGIWLAAPVADALLVLLTIFVLKRNNRNDELQYGLYFKKIA